MAEYYAILMKNLRKTMPTHLANLDTSKPFANGIRIMDVQYLLQSRTPVYYGDLVDHSFWSRLTIEVGAYTDGLNILTRRDGFTYKYNYPDKTFKVIDNHNTQVLQINNIETLADMKIDFTIFNSHQFEIYLTSEGGKEHHTFLIPAKFKEKKFETDLYENYVGVNNIYELEKYEVKPNMFAEKYLAYFGSSIMKFLVDPKKPDQPSKTIEEVKPIYKYYMYRNSLHTTFVFDINMSKAMVNQWKYWVYDIYREGTFAKKKKTDIGVTFVVDGKTINDVDKLSNDTVIKHEKTSDGDTYKITGNHNDNSAFIEFHKDGTVSITTNSGKIVDHKKLSEIKNEDIDGSITYPDGTVIKQKGKLKNENGKIILNTETFDKNGKSTGTLKVEIVEKKNYTPPIKTDFFATPMKIPRWDLPETGNGMYPMLNPIKRAGETQNNRPIYEPWLIYGFYNNVSRISHDDVDRYDINLLDLSPNYI